MGYYLNLLAPPKEEKNYFLKRHLLPVMTTYPFSEYPDGEVPLDQIVSIKIFSSYAQFAVMDIRMMGRGKTKLVGRALPYFHQLGWRQIIFDQKGRDFIDANKPMRRVKILKHEKQVQLPLEHLIPSFVLKTLPDIEEQFKVFSPKISNYKELEEFLTLGFTSGRQAQYILNKIDEEGLKVTVNYLLDCLKERGRDYYKVHPQTREALNDILMFLRGKAFFDEEKPSFAVGNSWKQGKIPVISSFSSNQSFNSAIFGKLIKEEFMTNNPKQKIIYCNDAHTVMPATTEVKNSVSMLTLKDQILTLGRESKWSIWANFQFPDTVNPDILMLFRPAWKILGAIPFSQNLDKIVPTWVKYDLDNLVDDPESDLCQAMLLPPDNKNPQVGYPLGSLIRHPSNAL